MYCCTLWLLFTVILYECSRLNYYILPMKLLNSYILSISPSTMRNSYSLLAHMQEVPKNTVIDWLTSPFFKSKIRGRANQKEDKI